MSGPVELKPCPFCGEDPGACHDASHSSAFEIECFNQCCNAKPIVWEVTEAKAVAAWNTRTDATKDAEIARLVAKNERMLEALATISKSSGDEMGCYYTNRSNIRTARAALSPIDPAGGMPVEVK